MDSMDVLEDTPAGGRGKINVESTPNIKVTSEAFNTLGNYHC